MALNLNLPDVCLSKISSNPHLFFKNDSEVQAFEAKYPQELWGFISKVGECSPYLERLSSNEKKWLRAVSNLSIEKILEDILAGIVSSHPQSLVHNCKLARRRSFLITAFFDLAGCLSLENISSILTVVADSILSALTDEIFHDELGNISSTAGSLDEINTRPSGKIKRKWPKFFVVAMGKMGAYELNYSSDIDIIFFLSSKSSSVEKQINERREYIKKARKLVKTLSSITDDDFIYRTDLRLRPDPASTPIVISTDFAQTYYQKVGRTWERMAFIKARPVAGDIYEAQKFLNTLENFIWRRHFDYAAIEDVKNLREKMKLDSTSINFEMLSGYNIKIGLGGIRDIELFTQTYQLIVGGRQKELRGQKTIDSLKTLAEMNWLKKEQSDVLIEAYLFLRNVENRLQMVNNTQTQTLPIENSLKFEELSFLLGFDNPQIFKNKLRNFLIYVKGLTDDFFTNFKFREVGKNIEILTKNNVSENSFKENYLIASNSDWLQNFNELRKFPIFRSSRSLKSFDTLIPALTTIINKSVNPSYTFSQFRDFLRELPSGVQLFPLLENNPGIINILIQICQSSNSITKILARDITLFDLLISEDFLKTIYPKTVIKSDLRLRLKHDSDYEFMLNELRRFARERKFQICIHLILNNINSLQAARFFSDTAEICIEFLSARIKKNLFIRYGSPARHIPCILGMGKLGSKEMNFYSDLDLILIYNSELTYNPKEKTNKSLTTYFARFTQALVSAFTSLTEEGRLYEVDMRLRPSGRQGPVATSLSSFHSYQNEKAWVWEHMALSRGRIISGDTTTKGQVLGVFEAVFGAGIHSLNTIKKQTLKMRKSLGEKFSSTFTPPEIKFGRGGMQELELLVQMGFLLTNLRYKPNHQSPRQLIKRLCDIGFFTKDEGSELLLAHTLYFNYQQTYCIFTVRILGDERLSDEGLFHLLKGAPNPKMCENIKCVEDLNKLLVKKSKFIGDLFDSKLK